MSAVGFAQQTITRRRYPLVDDYSTDVIDTDATPTDLDITGCWFEQIQSQVDTNGRLAVLSGYRCTAPAGTVLDPLTDHVLIAGVEHELTGDVQNVVSPTGALNEVVFSARRWSNAS